MLKVKRSAPPQQFFRMVEKPKDELFHWANRSPGERRQRRAPIDHDLFRQLQIVDYIVKDFEDRCAFCEKEGHGAEGVSHFRPLGLHDRHRAEEFVDHYSWLAYEWKNLMLICRRCQRAKADNFPVVDDRRARFLATLSEVRGEEKSLLIDPTSEDPSRYLTFLISGECIPRRNSEKSITTIELLKLNDSVLLAERRLAIESSLETWENALRGGGRIPEHFLLRGAFLGSCREAIARTLANHRPNSVSVNNGRALRAYLDEILINSADEKLVSIANMIEILRDSDATRLRESRSVEPATQFRAPISHVHSNTLPTRFQKNDIASVSVRNFRAIDQVRIDFPEIRNEKAGAPCLLLLGENAVGKSTCLSSIALALLGTNQVRKLKLPYQELARSTNRASWNVWGKAPLEVSVNFYHESRKAEFFYDASRERLDGTEDQSALVLGYGPHRYFAPARGRKGSSAADGVRSLFDPRKALPDPSEWLKALSGQQFDQVARTIRTILPTGDDDHLVNHPEYGICVLAQGQLTPVSHLSEGYRSIFAMVADICCSLLQHWTNLETAHAVVLIDEVETHLHPRWKMRVMSSLRRAFPRVQFIATTHDPLCVRGMDDGEVIVLTRDELGSVEIVADLPAISGMSAEQILTSEYFGLSSTLDPSIHLEIARLGNDVASSFTRDIGAEARELLSKVTLGDSASAQIIHAALRHYLREREEKGGNLSISARSEAVAAVFKALRASKAS